MRLYLSSFQLGDHADRLLALEGKRRRIAVIANALDAEPSDIRNAGLHREFDDLALAALGLRPEERDPIWTGLAVLDRPFVPHVDSPGHRETADCDRLSAQLSRGATPHWALRDGEVLLAEPNRSGGVLPRAQGR